MLKCKQHKSQRNHFEEVGQQLTYTSMCVCAHAYVNMCSQCSSLEAGVLKTPMMTEQDSADRIPENIFA